jgi:signal peptidase I
VTEPPAWSLSWKVVASLVAATLLLWLVLTQWVVTVTWMQSGSMAPTLKADAQISDGVLVDRLTLRFRAPRRYEIVFFRLDDRTWVLKRVMGLPGEIVEIKEGRVVVNKRPLTGPPADRIRYEHAGHLGPGKQVKIDPGHYLVLGDDSSDSFDSRFWGCVAATSLAGVARAIVWPPSSIRWFDEGR